MAARAAETLQERVKLLDQVRTHSRRWPLGMLCAALAIALAGAAAWDTGARDAPPWALIALSGLMVVGVLLVGGAFLRWKDALVRRYVELAVRRVREFEEASDATFFVNEDGRIEAVNAAGERLMGCSREALRLRPILEIIDVAPEGETPFITRLEAANGPLASSATRELAARRFDGGETPVDVTVRSLPTEDGGRFVAFYARDISDRKRVERLKDEFVSTVSHELRTPLTSIAGSLGLLVGGATAPLPDGPARLVGIAHANCQRLVRLINDILDVEKIESGKMKFELAPLTLADVAQRSIDVVKGFADQMCVTLTLEAAPDIDIRGDIDRLVQVGANLISNAVKFSKTGDVVEIRAERWGRLARITVEDHGPGVPDEFRARIFTKFAQADSSDTRQRGGTGLGLVIAKEITERHGGRLWFDSVLGQGTAFHIDLPLAETAESGVEGDGLGRLLVCEDDPDAAVLLKETLERDGFAVDVVMSAAEAQAALGVRNRYRALVLDLVLPDRHGLSLIQALREAPATRELPIIVVSAQAELGREQAGALDVIDWMEKPVDVARLRRAVVAALARNQVARATILHVDDDPDILTITATALAGCGEVVSVESLAAARAFLKLRTPHLVILDLALGDGPGLSLLPELNDAEDLPIPVLIFSAHDTDSSVLSRVAAVLTKSKTTLPNLAEAVRRLVAPSAAKAPAQRRLAS